jgi:hypothetical protein
MEGSLRGPHTVRNRASFILLALIGVSLLNEYVLKAAFHNWFTGKLSDFVGVAAFALFWCMLFPQARRFILLGSAAGFAFWKSPAAEGLISALNNILPFAVSRVVDWTDLIALAVLLPIARLTRDRATRFQRKKKWELAIIPLALFSFVAHQDTPTTVATYHVEYPFNVSMDSLTTLIKELPSTRLTFYNVHTNDYWFNIPWLCPDGLTAETRVLGSNTESRIRLMQITSYCQRDGWTVDRMSRLFADSVVTPLRARILGSSAARP